ncbi:Glycosyltransferase, GT2 family [Rhizobium sp. RU20A]|uniref:glycosyltransferase family 2 protein n=1 Tax=Rhizobium sp. RU20A TaxID=1907412 RepID=UPI0009567AD1|nr:glycosyltransferase family A protein [Rhizobium sp. RU20A]SIQ55014.1 Glycosyltransferase, GT2 family [Rhizobium sp. RU20A]
MTGEPITVYFRCGQELPEAIRVVITVPTFRRPEHLVKTLSTLISQSSPLPFAVVVIENDAEGQAGAVAARDFFAAHETNGLVIVTRDRGNCHAYNGGWQAALDTYPMLQAIAVIDDDEVAAPDWLSRLLSVQAATKAELVGGPQLPVFEAGANPAFKHHPVFMPHYDTTGPVPILYSSGNVLITRPVLDAMPRPFLDTLFNFTGGGDSDFYRRAKLKGFRFAWAKEAWVAETVPLRRTERSWIRARSLRTGALSAMLEHRADPSVTGRTKTILKSLALLALSPLRGFRLWRRSGLAMAGLFHAEVAIGRLMAEAGLINEQYRNPEKN